MRQHHVRACGPHRNLDGVCRAEAASFGSDVVASPSQHWQAKIESDDKTIVAEPIANEAEVSTKAAADFSDARGIQRSKMIAKPLVLREDAPLICFIREVVAPNAPKQITPASRANDGHSRPAVEPFAPVLGAHTRLATT